LIVSFSHGCKEEHDYIWWQTRIYTYACTAARTPRSRLTSPIRYRYAHEVKAVVTHRTRDLKVSEFKVHLRLPFFLFTYLCSYYLPYMLRHV